ncbi:butyrophilin 2 [Labeo rohita]|uniref:Butyrophilin 2 n=1 Tax=Labeo rohita TaxID=84645 RepID=A0A498MDQ2_LABRO|nr:butyrophilin 2 [Labeo rohita]
MDSKHKLDSQDPHYQEGRRMALELKLDRVLAEARAIPPTSHIIKGQDGYCIHEQACILPTVKVLDCSCDGTNFTILPGKPVILITINAFTVEESDSLVVPLESSVVLPCQINKRLLKKGLEVEWRRMDSETLDHLYQDGSSQTKKQQQDYHDRAHFFTNQIQHGNFSLRLDNLRAEDEGRYTCKVYSEKDCVYSVITDLELWFEVKHSCRMLAPLGSSVVLPCYVNKHSLIVGLEVEWRRTDSETGSSVSRWQD